jgi:alpha-galactosidase
MKSLRIVIIGGGSYNWTPGLVRDLVVRPEVQNSTIVLQDIDSESLELTFRFSQMLVETQNAACKIERTLDLDTALTGADVVVVTITTGGLESMRADLEVPAKYGIYQSVGDTVGPGGLSRALRNIPVLVDIARRIERLCPDAWMLNITNPMTTLCRAVALETRVKVVGLCHEYFEGLRALVELLGVSEEAIETKVGGINHLIWLLDLKVNGRDAFPELRRCTKELLGKPVEPEMDPTVTSLLDRNRVKAQVFQIFDFMPMANDRHVAEFFPYFLSEAVGKGRRYGVKLTTVEERYLWAKESETKIRALLEGEQDRRDFLDEDSREAVAPICAALATDGHYEGILNLPNRGQITNLPDDIIVETFGKLTRESAAGLPVGALPPAVLNIVSTHTYNQEMIVEAALTGNRRLALQALVNDPLVTDIDSAEAMLTELLGANRDFLPKFFAADA